jgi:hypothetical protein
MLYVGLTDRFVAYRRPGGGSDEQRRPTHAAHNETMAPVHRNCLGVLSFLLIHQAVHAQSK